MPIERPEPLPSKPLIFLVWLVMLCALFREITLQGTLIYIGEFNLTVSDPIVFVGGLVLAGYARRRPNLTWGTILVVGYALIIAFNVLRGLAVTPYDAIVTLRLNGGFVVLLLLGAYLRADEWWHPSIVRALVVTGTLLSFLVALRIGFGPGFPFGSVANAAVNEINDGGRALSAQGTMLVVMAAVVLLAMYMSPKNLGGGRSVHFVISVLFCLVVAATRQGMAAIVCVVAWVSLYSVMPGQGRSARAMLGVGLGSVAIFLYYIVPEIISLDAFNDVLPKGLAFDLSRREATFKFREAIWAGLLHDRESWTLLSQLFGLPAGVKPSIWIDYWGGTLWQLSVHSMYYGLLPVAGVVGLVIYCAILVVVAVARLSDVIKGYGVPGAALGFVFVVMAALAGISNDLRHENGLLIAAALVGYTSRRHTGGLRSPVEAVAAVRWRSGFGRGTARRRPGLKLQ